MVVDEKKVHCVVLKLKTHATIPPQESEDYSEACISAFYSAWAL